MLDYAAIAIARLTGQFENSPKLQALMGQIVGPLAVLEVDADLLTTDRWIDTAIGAQLDACGYIVRESRKGRDDDAYRQAIKFRVLVNISKGTPPELINGLRFLTDPTDAQYLESYPATVLLFSNGYFIDYLIQPAIQEISPAAICTVPVMVSFMDAPLRFGQEGIPDELFVNDAVDYLTAEGSDIQLSTSSLVNQSASTLGGVVPADLAVGADIYLDLGGPTLAVYDPNSLHTLGHDNLTGVFL